MEDWASYWAAIAQILPVLGLAHVLETRQMVKAAAGIPGFLRTIVAVGHFLTLAALSTAFYNAIIFMRPGSTANPYFTNELISIVIPVSIGVLLFSPAINAFFAAAAFPVSKISWTHGVLKLSLWRARRQLTRLIIEERKQAGWIAQNQEKLLEARGRLADSVKYRDRFSSTQNQSDKAPNLGITFDEYTKVVDQAGQMLTEIEGLILEATAKREKTSLRIVSIQNDLDSAANRVKEIRQKAEISRERWVLRLAGADLTDSQPDSVELKEQQPPKRLSEDQVATEQASDCSNEEHSGPP